MKDSNGLEIQVGDVLRCNCGQEKPRCGQGLSLEKHRRFVVAEVFDKHATTAEGWAISTMDAVLIERKNEPAPPMPLNLSMAVSVTPRDLTALVTHVMAGRHADWHLREIGLWFYRLDVALGGGACAEIETALRPMLPAWFLLEVRSSIQKVDEAGTMRDVAALPPATHPHFNVAMGLAPAPKPEPTPAERYAAFRERVDRVLARVAPNAPVTTDPVQATEERAAGMLVTFGRYSGRTGEAAGFEFVAPYSMHVEKFELEFSDILWTWCGTVGAKAMGAKK